MTIFLSFLGLLNGSIECKQSLCSVFSYIYMQVICTGIFTFFHFEEMEKILPDIVK